jgi:hypothetical protein
MLFVACLFYMLLAVTLVNLSIWKGLDRVFGFFYVEHHVICKHWLYAFRFYYLDSLYFFHLFNWSCFDFQYYMEWVIKINIHFLAQDLRGNSFKFLSFSMILIVDLSHISFIILRRFSSNHNLLCILSQRNIDFLFIHWYDKYEFWPLLCC